MQEAYYDPCAHEVIYHINQPRTSHRFGAVICAVHNASLQYRESPLLNIKKVVTKSTLPLKIYLQKKYNKQMVEEVSTTTDSRYEKYIIYHKLLSKLANVS